MPVILVMHEGPCSSLPLQVPTLEHSLFSASAKALRTAFSRASIACLPSCLVCALIVRPLFGVLAKHIGVLLNYTYARLSLQLAHIGGNRGYIVLGQSGDGRHIAEVPVVR